MRNTKLKLSRVVEAQAPRENDRLVQPRRQKPVPRKIAAVPYEFVAGSSMPKVGDSVMVMHRSEADRHGNIVLKRSDSERRTVKSVYLSDSKGFSIKDNAGDTWLVRPAAIGGTNWETFIPGDKQRVLK